MRTVESPYLQYLHDKYRFPRSIVHRRIQRFLRGHLETAPAGARVLDAGCGNGSETGPYTGRLRVLGLDYQREYAAYCARRYPQGTYVVANLSRLPVADGRFDLVVMNQVIEHLEDPLEVIGELARALSPGGRLLVATPNYGGRGWPLVEATYHRWFPADFDPQEHHVVHYRPETLRTHLASALVVERVEAICANLILVGAARKPAAPTTTAV
jgi:SAM-dependent methyltransferase